MLLPGEYFPKAHATGSIIILPADMPLLVMIYSIGYAAIWLIFYLLYRHAWKKKETLYLTAQQQLEIQRQLRGAFLNISIGVTALVFAALGFTVISGICFILILPDQLYNDRYHRKQLKTHIITAQKS
jgi:hypothetical protein